MFSFGIRKMGKIIYFDTEKKDSSSNVPIEQAIYDFLRRPDNFAAIREHEIAMREYEEENIIDLNSRKTKDLVDSRYRKLQDRTVFLRKLGFFSKATLLFLEIIRLLIFLILSEAVILDSSYIDAFLETLDKLALFTSFCSCSKNALILDFFKFGLIS